MHEHAIRLGKQRRRIYPILLQSVGVRQEVGYPEALSINKDNYERKFSEYIGWNAVSKNIQS